MKVLAVGATGVLGRNVIPRLVERGHTVKAIIRRPEQARFLKYTGAEPLIGDIFDEDSLNLAARGCDAALHLATTIPKSGEQDWSLNDRIRREGTRNFIAAASNNGVKRYIQQSITLLYGDQGQAIVDETAPLQLSEEINKLAQNVEYDWDAIIDNNGPATADEIIQAIEAVF